VLVARLDDGHAAGETAWIHVDNRGEPPVLVARRTPAVLPADDPDCRYPKQGPARAFDPRDGRVGADPIDVLSLSETIVPAMITAAAPIIAGDQIVFLLGNYRGDIWMLDLQSPAS
jgi:hypothetical protein